MKHNEHVDLWNDCRTFCRVKRLRDRSREDNKSFKGVFNQFHTHFYKNTCNLMYLNFPSLSARSDERHVRSNWNRSMLTRVTRQWRVIPAWNETRKKYRIMLSKLAEGMFCVVTLTLSWGLLICLSLIILVGMKPDRPLSSLVRTPTAWPAQLPLSRCVHTYGQKYNSVNLNDSLTINS